MNTLNQITFLLFCLVSLNLSYAQNGKDQARNPIVVIDPGHGGKDAGAIGINGIREKDIVLDISFEVLRLNKKSDKPLKMYLTRYSDTLIALSDRTKLSKALKADLFVSLHCNNSKNWNARGIEVYVADATSVYSDGAILVAYKLQETFKRQLGFESRGVKFANFQVLRETVDYCPTVLLELGFLSNIDENNYYDDLSGIKAVALVIMESLMKNREL